ncbi:MAG TPA: HAD-IIIA family hydrolase [Desulfobacterales bacterium]|nr:HAD-IIIA family hydrolase [Desulfobacterales bacterium]
MKPGQKIADDAENIDKLKRIKLLALDVDGVLTDGGIIYSNRGQETKVFNVKDGLGIRLLMASGIEVCVITGRRSKALYHRCSDLGITDIYDDVSDKAEAINLILEQTGFSAEEIAFVGDDLPDLSIMKRVGLPIAVADAHRAVVESADMVTSVKGGMGAVREVCETILKAQGVWERAIEHFL